MTSTGTTPAIPAPTRPGAHRVRSALVGLEVALAVAALAGSIALVGGGTDLGGAVDDLPWDSALFGGLALAVVNTLVPGVVAYGELARQPWARAGHLVVGVALVSWILVQVAIIGPISWMQPFCLLWGALIFGLGVANWRASDPRNSRSPVA
jgi:hypothetical protein